MLRRATAHCERSLNVNFWLLKKLARPIVLYLEYFFHIKLDLRLVIVDRNKLHFTSSYFDFFLMFCWAYVDSKRENKEKAKVKG